MISMMFLLLFIFGLMHMSMFAVSKYMANYAAWAAARTAMVQGSGSGLRFVAAQHVLDDWRWAQIFFLNQTTRTVRGKGRSGTRVITRVPFGLPIYTSLPLGGVLVYGFGPISIQPNVTEKGDNQ
ncbi:MAG: hypothetical protein HYX76_08620 [Acidobacteria bacterium]|nr:hypothetical protein [Acidobacteriota bacterium]